ncbi:MAG: HAMP domain-containing protein [Ignavibacteriales bacterium]|nr:MAG: HAMP domain-containing protein [Ignavibacteriales bacterium]
MLKLYTTSLRSKILLGFTVILLIMSFATLWSIYNFYRLNEQIKITMQQNYTSIIAADNMGRALDEQLQSIVIMLNQNFEVGEKLFEKTKQDFYYWYDRSRESVPASEEKDIRNILDDLNSEYQRFVKDISDNIDYNIYISNKRQTLRSDFVRFVDEIQSIKKRNNSILEINHSALNGAVSRVKDITQGATITILIILFGAIATSLAFGSRFSDYIVKPISNLRQSVTHIAEGNFNERIEIDENGDEISSLAEEFNKMSEKLQVYEQFNLNKILYEKKKSELIIESMNEPVLMVDENFDVMLSNKTFNEVFGESLLTQHNIQKILAPQTSGSKNDTTQVSKDLYQKEDIINIKYGSGDQKYFKVIAASLDIPESNTKGTVIVFNDITKYQELDRMKSEFIAKVSHELKTPLTSIGMALGIFEDGVVGSLSQNQNELILSMKEDFERLNRLVYEILELTKLEANIGKSKFEKFEAQKLAEHISKKFLIQAKEKKINLQIIDKSNKLMINGSYDNMISALENLVSNSLRFTPTGGEIKVNFSRNNGNLLIEISDTGIGISPDNLKKIFDKFIQIDDSAPGSLGLGLSIAKEVIELHNGEIKAFSDLGKGSTFQIKLPEA